MTDKILRAIPVVALVMLLAYAGWKLIAPEVDLRQTIAQNLVLQAQVNDLAQKNQQQLAALTALYQDAELKPVITRKFPQMFSPVQPVASNGAAQQGVRR